MLRTRTDLKERECIKLRKKSLVHQIERLAKESHTSPSAWVTELVEDFIQEHRTGRSFKPSPDRFTMQNPEYDHEEHSLDLYERKPICV